MKKIGRNIKKTLLPAPTKPDRHIEEQFGGNVGEIWYEIMKTYGGNECWEKV